MQWLSSALLLYIIATSVGIGLRISVCMGVRYSSRIEGLTYAAGLGLLIYILIAIVLGILGCLTMIVVMGVMAGASLAFFRLRRNLSKSVDSLTDDRPSSSFERGLSLLLAVFFMYLLLSNFIGANAPEVIWDAHSYHLNVAKRWMQAGEMIYLPGITFSNWPLGLSGLYAMEMIVVEGTTLPQLTHFSFGVLCAFMIFSSVRSRYGLMPAVLAGVLFYSIPVVAWLSRAAISDLGVAYYAAFAMAALHRACKDWDIRWIIMVGIGAGGAMSIKLTGLFLLLACVLTIIVAGLIKHAVIPKLIKASSILSIIALLIAAPWYLKSLIHTRNPIFPFAYDLFGGRYWNESVNARFLAQQFAFQGIGRNIVDYLLLPFRLLKPEHMPYEGPVPLLLMIAFVWGVFHIRKKDTVLLAPFIAIYSALWAVFSTQVVRMLLPSLVSASMLFGMMINDWKTGASAIAVIKIQKLAEKVNRCLVISIYQSILIILCILITFSGIKGFVRETKSNFSDQVEVFFGIQTRDEYLNKHFYLSKVFSYINNNLDENDVILGFNEVRGFLSNPMFVWGSPTLQAYIDYDNLPTRAQMLGRLYETGVTHILINNWEYPSNADELAPIWDDLVLEFQEDEVFLYRILY